MKNKTEDKAQEDFTEEYVSEVAEDVADQEALDALKAEEEAKEQKKKQRKILRGIIIFAVDVVLFFVLQFVFDSFFTHDTKVNLGMGIAIFVAVLWLTEAVPIAVTALMVPVLAVMTGILGTEKALESFADPIIFMFLGGFTIATALRSQKIDKYIADKVVSLSRGSFLRAAYLLFGVTAFLSMWINNLSATVIMVPLALGILSHLNPKKDMRTFVFLLLGIAYSSSIGGIGSLIGTGTNGVTAKYIPGMDFTNWMAVGLPFALVMLPIMVLTLHLVLRPKINIKVNSQGLENEKMEWNSKQVLTLVIFAITALLWVFSAPITDLLEQANFGELAHIKSSEFNAIVAISTVVVFCLSGVVTWKDVESNTQWGVLLLFGGGLTLSAILSTSGASNFIGNYIASLLEGLPIFIVVFVVALFIVILTEFTSNMASAALLIPIFVTASPALHLPSDLLALVIGIGASLAFTLPVATPPNALVLSTGYIPEKMMIRVGVVLSSISVFVLTAFALLVWNH